MLNVFLTVDTEFWPRQQYVNPLDYRNDFNRDIHGFTPDGNYGLGFQLDTLNSYGLRAVFLVEALNAFVVGPQPLQEIVSLVQEANQDLQLHLHPEWLKWMPQPILPREPARQHMHQFTEEEQIVLIASGLEKLRECGAGRICAFRAGNYGADLTTLRALAYNDILYDTSFNTCYRNSACLIDVENLSVHPKKVAGVLEVPIPFFRDIRGIRHAQLAACSSAEMEYFLLKAWEEQWQSFVIVSHSFELLVRPGNSYNKARINTVTLQRFENLCKFLKANKDKFRTCTFADPPDLIESDDSNAKPIRMRTSYTLWRYAEQLQQKLQFNLAAMLG